MAIPISPGLGPIKLGPLFVSPPPIYADYVFDALVTATGFDVLVALGTVTATVVYYVQLPPVATVTAGSWTSTGPNLWSVLDEPVTDDADYISSAAVPVDDVTELDLLNPLTTTTPGTTTITVRVKK